MRRLIQQTQSGEAKPCCPRSRRGGSKAGPGERFITTLVDNRHLPLYKRSGGVERSPPSSSFSDTSRLRFSEGQNRKCCLHCTGGWRNTLKHSRWLSLLFGWECQYLSCNTAQNKPQLQPLAELVVSDWFQGSSLWIQRIYPLQIRDPGKWQQRCQIIQPIFSQRTSGPEGRTVWTTCWRTREG